MHTESDLHIPLHISKSSPKEPGTVWIDIQSAMNIEIILKMPNGPISASGLNRTPRNNEIENSEYRSQNNNLSFDYTHLIYFLFWILTSGS